MSGPDELLTARDEAIAALVAWHATLIKLPRVDGQMEASYLVRQLPLSTVQLLVASITGLMAEANAAVAALGQETSQMAMGRGR